MCSHREAALAPRRTRLGKAGSTSQRFWSCHLAASYTSTEFSLPIAMTNFLSLPGEIRNAIYDLILFPRFPIVLIRASHVKDILSTTHKSPLYRTSRALRSEVFARLCKTKMLDFMDYKSFRVCMLRALCIQPQHKSPCLHRCNETF